VHQMRWPSKDASVRIMEHSSPKGERMGQANALSGATTVISAT
jgi:hypothetical protein